MDKIQEVLIKMGRKDLAQKYYKKINKNAIENLSRKEKQFALIMKAKGYNYAVQISTVDGDYGEPLYFKSSNDIGPLLRPFPDDLNAKIKWSINLETIKEASWYGNELLPVLQEEFGKKLPSKQFLIEWAKDAGEKEIYEWLKKAPESDLKALAIHLKKMGAKILRIDDDKIVYDESEMRFVVDNFVRFLIGDPRMALNQLTSKGNPGVHVGDNVVRSGYTKIWDSLYDDILSAIKKNLK
jgi:hypothetical protein